MSWVDDAERKGRESGANNQAEAERRKSEQKKQQEAEQAREQQVRAYLEGQGGEIDAVAREMVEKGYEVRKYEIGYGNGFGSGRMDNYGKRFAIEKLVPDGPPYRDDFNQLQQNHKNVYMCRRWGFGALGGVEIYPMTDAQGELYPVVQLMPIARPSNQTYDDFMASFFLSEEDRTKARNLSRHWQGILWLQGKGADMEKELKTYLGERIQILAETSASK